MLLLIVPIAYIGLKLFNLPPNMFFMVHIVVEMCTQYARLRIVLPMIRMKLRPYVKRSIISYSKGIVISTYYPNYSLSAYRT